MKDLGNRAEDATFDFAFNTHEADGTPATLSGSPSVAIYKGNSTTEITAGITLTADFDSVTGLNHVRVDTSNAAYETGNDYVIVIAAGTVDSVDVSGVILAGFSIDNRLAGESSGETTGFSAAALAQLAGINVTVVTPYDPTKRQVTLKHGDDYLTAAGTAITFTNSNNTWHDLSTVDTVRMGGRREDDTFTAVGAITSETGPQTITIDIAAADWANIAAGTWNCDVEATLTSGHVVTLFSVLAIVQPDYAAPAT